MLPLSRSQYLSLPFKSEPASQNLTNSLYRALRRTFPAGTLRCWFMFNKLINLRLKDKVSVHDQSRLTYSFSCSCSKQYIYRMTKRLLMRIKEHHPAWFRTGERKTMKSEIVSHLVNSNHQFDPNSVSKVIYSLKSLPESYTKSNIGNVRSTGYKNTQSNKRNASRLWNYVGLTSRVTTLPSISHMDRLHYTRFRLQKLWSIIT